MSDSGEIIRGKARARRLYPRSKHFRNAYMRGVQAALAFEPSAACPYRAAESWRQAYRLAWLRGWQSVERPGEG